MTKNTTEHFDQGGYGIDPRDADTPDNWVNLCSRSVRPTGSRVVLCLGPYLQYQSSRAHLPCVLQRCEKRIATLPKACMVTLQEFPFTFSSPPLPRPLGAPPPRFDPVDGPPPVQCGATFDEAHGRGLDHTARPSHSSRPRRRAQDRLGHAQVRNTALNHNINPEIDRGTLT